MRICRRLHTRLKLCNFVDVFKRRARHQCHCNVTGHQGAPPSHLINGTPPIMKGQTKPKDIATIFTVGISKRLTIHPFNQHKFVHTQDSCIPYLRYLAWFENGTESQCQTMCHAGSFLLCQDSVANSLHKRDHGRIFRKINQAVLSRINSTEDLST